MPNRTLSQIVTGWAGKTPHAPALVFLGNGEEETARLSYAQLDRGARRLAWQLAQRGLVGERVLILLPSGPDYVLSLLGCLYAGVIAVPVYPPHNNHHARRMAAIARDAGAQTALTSAGLALDVPARLAEAGFEDMQLIAVDALDPEAPGWINEAVDPGQLAYLQYTSGSTGDPKGVMVSQAALVLNCELFSTAMDLHQGEPLLSWLPIFHDWGLVQGVAMPLVLGATSILMPPTAFIQRPARWLRAVERYRAVFACGPNFAYELCLNKIDPEESEGLDLSSCRVMLSGAEPIACHTLQAFARRFAANGLREDALCGAYGLAEATLYVTAGDPGRPNRVLHVDKSALARDRVQLHPDGGAHTLSLASSGQVFDAPAVSIVDPHTRLPCTAQQVGEIWISGDCVCAGYWQRPDISAETFAAVLADGSAGAWLRTGDLGFIHDGELYVTGRLKDLIIIRGTNHYPQDIEATVEAVSPVLRKGGWGAAFTLEEGSGQRLVVVQEVERAQRRQVDAQALGLAIARAVTDAHGVDVDQVVLALPGAVPKTSSGKIQRKACADMVRDGGLKAVGHWRRPAPARTAALDLAATTERVRVVAGLRTLVAGLTGVPVGEVSTTLPFTALGLDSVKAVQLAGDIGQASGRELPATAAFDYPTIERLADRLLGRAETNQAKAGDYEPIAIVGLDCRFPGAEGPEAFWELLCSGRSAVSEVGAQRQALTGYRAGSDAPFRWGGFLDDVAGFDAALFGISPREAACMDPQQRLLLETAWRALEHAGIAPDSLGGSRTGVFVGVSANDYFRLQGMAGADWDNYSGTGGALSVTANRLSYCLGLQGPSLAVDTACSSSLVALHQACRSLACGDSELAVAGGVNLVLSTDYGRIFTRAQMLSPSGQCRTFDDGADGYVRGEGCGVVVLKRLAQAQRDGDRVLAVIRGSAINQDGHSNGLTAPNGLAQQQVVRSALQRAGLGGTDIGYVETHGTGTPLGDPIEVSALRAVLDAPADTPAQPCWLGAVKTRIGHLESAAGIAGLIKTVLVLRHGRIPPNGHFQRLNRHIQLGGSRLRPAAETVDWPATDTPRRAGVSSFGFGGANAHVVLESVESPDNAATKGAVPPGCVLTLSAHTDDSLRRLALDYAAGLRKSDPAGLAAICRRANTTRARLGRRLAVAAAEVDDMVAALADFAAGRPTPAVQLGQPRQAPRLAFLFTGQGAQYAGMGDGLYWREPVFRRHIDACDGILRPWLERPLLEILRDTDGRFLADTRFQQPALVALQTALATLWRHWGVEPEFVVGHSVGEFAAAFASGVMDLETVLPLVAERGRLMAQAPGSGGMASVHAPLAAIEQVLGSELAGLDLAAVNAPDQTVLSGSPDVLDAALDSLARNGLQATRLTVSHAFHSRAMLPILAEFRALVERVNLRAPAASWVAATDAGTDPTDPAYWVEQLRRPVRFAEAMERLAFLGADTFLEVGPAPVLVGLGRRCIDGGTWLASLRPQQDEALYMRRALGGLFVAGARADLRGLDDHLNLPPATAPAYPFDRKPYWFAAGHPAAAGRAAGRVPLLGARLDVAVDGLVCFEADLPADAGPYLPDHRVHGHSIMPAAGYVSLIDAAARAAGLVAAGGRLALGEVQLLRPLALEDGATRVQTLLRRENDTGPWQATILARQDEHGPWESYASAVLHLEAASSTPTDDGMDEAPAPTAAQDVAAFYAQWARLGLAYGPSFQALTALDGGDGQVRARVRLPDGVAACPPGTLHPVLLDAAFQALGVLLQPTAGGRVPLPVGIERLHLHGRCADALCVEGCLRDGGGERVTADVRLTDADGAAVAEVSGLTLAWADAATVLRERTPRVRRFHVGWAPAQASLPAAVRGGRWLRVSPSAGSALSALAVEDVPLADLPARLAEADAVAGVVFWCDPAPEEEDPAAACIELCRQLQAAITAVDTAPGLPAGFPLCLVTHGAMTAAADEMPSVSQAALGGLLRSAAQEYPTRVLRHLDLPVVPDAADIAVLARELTADGESQLAIRADGVRVPRLQPAPVATADAPALRGDATYLVTGGTGGLGIELAAWLAGRGARHLVLVSRRGDLNDAAAARLDGLRRLGVTVQVERADLGEAGAVGALMDSLDSRPWPLRGVFHAAGVLDDRPLPALDEAAWRQAMAAKLAAAARLDRHTRGKGLEHFVAFSSIAAVIGSAGQCNYAAANAALDALMARRRRCGEAAVTVNWGPWAEVGMASEPALAARLTRQGLAPMAPRAALHALGEAMSSGAGQTVVARLDALRLGRHQPQAGVPSVLRALLQPGSPAPAAPVLADAQALAAMPQAEAAGAILRGLGGLIGAVLGIDPQQAFPDEQTLADARLSALGLDSLMAAELRRQVRDWLGVDAPYDLLIGGAPLSEVLAVLQRRLLVQRLGGDTRATPTDETEREVLVL